MELIPASKEPTRWGLINSFFAQSRMLHVSAVLGALILSSLFTLFLWFVCESGRVMDKSGYGDMELWKVLQVRAKLFFWSTVVVWLVLIGLGLFRQGSERSQIFVVCGITIVVAPFLFLWIAL